MHATHGILLLRRGTAGALRGLLAVFVAEARCAFAATTRYEMLMRQSATRSGVPRMIFDEFYARAGERLAPTSQSGTGPGRRAGAFAEFPPRLAGRKGTRSSVGKRAVEHGTEEPRFGSQVTA